MARENQKDAAELEKGDIAAATQTKEVTATVEAQEARRSKLEETQHNLLLMEQSAAFYALQYGEHNSIAQDFESARQELENKMRQELFVDWAARAGYTGSPQKAEYPEADKKVDKETTSTGDKQAEVISHAPFTEEDLQELLKQPRKPESPDEQEVIRRQEEIFRPLIVQENVNGDNIVILGAGEVLGRRGEEPSLPKEAQDTLRDAHKEESGKVTKEETGRPEEKEKIDKILKTPEQIRADELRKEIARLAVEAPEMVASDIIKLQQELDQLEKGPTKKHRGWGWLKERAKGLATIGFWEVHQAERLRSSTKEVAKDVGARTGEVQKTTHLNLEDALAEAEKIQFALEAAGKTKDEEKTTEDINRLSEAITTKKVEQNDRVIDETVRQAESELRRRLEKYRNEFGERVVRDDKTVAETMNRLRAELKQLQDGQRETDVREIKTVLRSLDPKYWRRYVYGGVEAALWAAGGYLAWTKLAAEKTIATGVKVIQPTLPGDMNMHNTIWQSSKELLVNHGVSNPTDAEVLQLAKPVAELNGIGVKVWHLLGHPMDTMMQQGYLLKVPKEALKAVLRARGINI